MVYLRKHTWEVSSVDDHTHGRDRSSENEGSFGTLDSDGSADNW